MYQVHLAMSEIKTHNFNGDIYALIAQLVENPTTIR
jgi:hypothetical protein